MCISEYYYFYGSGTEPNRKIEFFSDPKKGIFAKVKAFKGDGNWTDVSDVSGEKIVVEMESISDKVDAIMKARERKESPIFNNKSMSELSPETRRRIIDGLQPKGSWRITITNEVGGSEGNGKVESLHIFNPS